MAALLIGCGDPKATSGDASADAPTTPAADIVEHGGSRLHLMWWQAADGSRALRGLYDAQLNFECDFSPRTDGVTFDCLPPVYQAPVGYADAQCTQPIMDWPVGSPPPPVVVAFSSQPCNGGNEHTAVYAPNVRIPGTKIYRTYGHMGTCTEETADEGTLLSVKPIDVVTAKLTPSPSSTILTPWYFAASDGSILSGQFIDNAIHDRCYLSETLTGFNCTPGPTATVEDQFSDATCTSHVIRTTGTCRAYPLAYDGVNYRRMGVPLTQMYTSANQTCSAMPAPAGYVSMGPVYDLPIVGKEHGTGSTRLQPIIATTEDGLRQHLGYSSIGYATVFDTSLGTECAFQRTPDMTMRCLPKAPVLTAYTDATCTTPIEATPFDVKLASKYGMPDRFMVMDVYEVGPATMLYAKGNVCGPVMGHPVVGDAVPLDTFLAGTPTMD